jgi:hypothetical protein
MKKADATGSRDIDLAGLVISTNQAGVLLKLTQPRLSQLEQAGWIARVGPGRWRLIDLIQGYVGSLKDETKRSSQTATLSAVQAARAREIEMRIAREEHKLIDLDEALSVLDEIVGGMKSDFDGLAASVTRDPTLRSTIEVKVDEIYTRHADGLDQKARALRTSGTAIEADPEDDAGSVGNQESPISG